MCSSWDEPLAFAPDDEGAWQRLARGYRAGRAAAVRPPPGAAASGWRRDRRTLDALAADLEADPTCSSRCAARWLPPACCVRATSGGGCPTPGERLLGRSGGRRGARQPGAGLPALGCARRARPRASPTAASRRGDSTLARRRRRRAGTHCGWRRATAATRWRARPRRAHAATARSWTSAARTGSSPGRCAPAGPTPSASCSSSPRWPRSHDGPAPTSRGSRCSRATSWARASAAPPTTLPGDADVVVLSHVLQGRPEERQRDLTCPRRRRADAPAAACCRVSRCCGRTSGARWTRSCGRSVRRRCGADGHMLTTVDQDVLLRAGGLAASAAWWVSDSTRAVLGVRTDAGVKPALRMASNDACRRRAGSAGRAGTAALKSLERLAVGVRRRPRRTRW